MLADGCSTWPPISMRRSSFELAAPGMASKQGARVKKNMCDMSQPVYVDVSLEMCARMCFTKPSFEVMAGPESSLYICTDLLDQD